MCTLSWFKDIIIPALIGILTIIAILRSPIIALRVQKKMEGLNNQKERKLDIFKTLMATRADTVSFDHVKALNMIDIEFYSDRTVTSAWEVYRDHLNSFPQNTSEAKRELWDQGKAEKLAELLFEISKNLGYDFNKILLQKGVYAPLAHGLLNNEQASIRRGCVELLNGAKTLKVELATPAQDRSQQG